MTQYFVCACAKRHLLRAVDKYDMRLFSSSSLSLYLCACLYDISRIYLSGYLRTMWAYYVCCVCAHVKNGMLKIISSIHNKFYGDMGIKSFILFLLLSLLRALFAKHYCIVDKSIIWYIPFYMRIYFSIIII